MGSEWGDCIRAIALQTPWRKPRRYALCAHLMSLKRHLRGGAGHHIPAHEDSADQGARQARAGTPPGEGRDHGCDRQERHDLDGVMVESGTKAGSGSGLNSIPVSHSVPYCKPSSTMKPSVSAKILVR